MGWSSTRSAIRVPETLNTEQITVGKRKTGSFPRPAPLCLTVVAFLLLLPRPSAAAIAIEVLCPALAPETAAAFEARSRADLLVRGEHGILRLDCSPAAQLRWTPENGAARSAAVSDLSSDGLLETLQLLLTAPKPLPPSAPAPLPRSLPPSHIAPAVAPTDAPRSGEPTRHVPPHRKPSPATLELRAAADAQVWDQKVALGGHAGVAWQFRVLSAGLSGHVSRSLVSFNQVALYLVELRAGAELHLLESLRLGLSSGLGRPLTTSPANFLASNNDSNPWFLEGGARLSVPLRWSKTVRVDVGAEWVVLSRRLRLFVNDTDAFDFQSRPGIFLELVLERPSP
jgi:hypothetical protein